MRLRGGQSASQRAAGVSGLTPGQASSLRVRAGGQRVSYPRCPWLDGTWFSREAGEHLGPETLPHSSLRTRAVA